MKVSKLVFQSKVFQTLKRFKFIAEKFYSRTRNPEFLFEFKNYQEFMNFEVMNFELEIQF